MSGRHNHYNDHSFQRGIFDIDLQVQQAVEELRKKGVNVLTAAKAALKESADIIVADMRSRVPIYKGKSSRPIRGALHDSIKAERLQDGAIYEFSANARNPQDNFLYGPVVEFAEWTKLKGEKRNKKKKAFMYPALDAHVDEVNQMVKSAIKQAITRGR